MLDLKGLALGIGVFIIVLGIFGIVFDESKKAIDIDYCGTGWFNSTAGNCQTGSNTINSSFEKGITAMYTGGKFGTTLMIVGVLAAIMAMFKLVRA